MKASRRRLIFGGCVFTADTDRPRADAVVVDGERIAYVGDAETAAAEAGDDAERIDADGGLVVPGFVDGHVHVILTGGSLRKAKLMRAGSLEEILRRVREWAEAHPDEPRVLGTGWLHSDLPDPHPTRQMLDAIIPDRPVYLEAHDFHSSWVNSAALAELSIDRKTPDPPGGEIVRDPDTGEATGHLLEGAHFNLVWPKLADVDDTTRDVQIATALEAYASAGITSVVEMALEEPALLAMARAHYVRARLIGNQSE